ncbi:MAG TPA: aspartyl protease [Cyanobacteria bacterium UBA11149]|nr:aspartyl protease [Cyanobacteria bacterium UBA11366]HBK65721.1 aspartyl protease [Cyanobacteria bacterium UBA11166]HBR76236.1 aspartyl protease [Cyanobacteria bacterium UBA11159]HBS71293.1 aspartyl protease [Cyanobacteria bacterium UBA11153]HBW91976.1 aspartyl protease [Cyanobacteria bacterium UBA11149]HCA96951.1 aspartyl protease [Cyanobacteria bacterium UBA9226]
MWPNIYRRGILILLSSTLITACSKDENVNVAPPTPTPAPTAITTPSPTPKIAKSSLAKTPNTPIHDTFEEATDTAISAVTISQSTVSREDWKLVANRWQEAINLMKKVPGSSKNYKTAQAKIPEYQNKWEDAKKKAEPVVKIDPEQLETNPSFFSMPIKGKYGGIPIVEIAFNGRIFDMLFDTGATNTLIPLSAAASLDLKPVGATMVTVADGSRVLLPIAELKSIEADGRIKKKFKVSVAPPSMPFGLLGHDFFEGYDIFIKRDVIEFNRRTGN